MNDDVEPALPVPNLAQEEAFAQGMVKLLKSSPSLRNALVWHHFCGREGRRPGRTSIEVRRKVRRHTLDGKHIEIDLLLVCRAKKSVLAIELKGEGGAELHGQTRDIADVVANAFPEMNAVLLFATPNGTAANDKRFRSLTLNELLEPLQLAVSARSATGRKVRLFLDQCRRDYCDHVVRHRRQAAEHGLARMAHELVDAARSHIHEVPQLAAFNAKRERGYDRMLAEVQVTKEQGRQL